MKEDKMLKMNPDPFVNLFIQPNGELRTNRRDEMLIPKLQVKGKDYIRDDVRTYQKDDYVRNFLVDRLRSYQAGEFVKLDYDGNV